MTPEQEMQRGFDAEQWLESPIFKEAVVSVRAGIINAWASSPIRDKEGQHELRLLIKLLDDVIGYVKETAQTGKLAQIKKNELSVTQRIKELAGIR